MQPNLDLSNQQTTAICGSLGELLANTYVLYLKLQFFHWNVEGQFFTSWHATAETQYTELNSAIDEIAERIRALGHYTPGSFKQFLHSAFIDEFSVPKSAEEMAEVLLNNHEKIAQHLRTHWIPLAQQNNDEATAGLFSERLEVHEKFAWVLRSNLS